MSHTATVMTDGRVLIAGGQCLCGPTQVTNTAEIFDPVSGSFASTGLMLAGRFEHSAVLLPSGMVLIAAGRSNTFPAVAEKYDPASGQFLASGSMAMPRYSQTANALSDGRVLIAGGSGQGNLQTAEIFDEAANGFTTVPSYMTSPRQYAASALLNDGRVLITGGFNGQVYSASAELF
jgi:hypothetical protein